MIAELDAAGVRRWIELAAESLQAHRTEIDGMNVFPIADADTGTNMARTMAAAAQRRPGVSRSLAEPEPAGLLLARRAEAAVLAARGNSGVILAQLLTGMADSAKGCDGLDGPGLAAALRAGWQAACTAVATPVDGTILSVAEAAATGAVEADGTLAEVARAAVAGATAALADTPQRLPVLAAAGVVDAGGRGLLVVLTALAAVVEDAPTTGAAAWTAEPDAPALHPSAGFEVQYLLEADDAAAARIRVRLAALGDSVVVGRARPGLWAVHVHTADIGGALEAGLADGRPSRVEVSPLQTPDPTAGAGTGPEAATVLPSGGTAIVAVGPDNAAGLGELLRSEGVVVADPSQILSAILGCGAERVVVLPNSEDAQRAAELAAEQARQDGRVVAVVPTRSVMQGLAAVAVHDPARGFQENVIAVAEAAAATRTAEVTIAEDESITYAGRCQAGDVLGLIDGEVVEIGLSIPAVALRLVRRLIEAGGELVTVISTPEAAARAAAVDLVTLLKHEHPFVEVNVLTGGPLPNPLLIGVE